MLDSFSISDSVINKVLRQLFIICLCVVTFVLVVRLRSQALKTPLVLLIWLVFLLENIHQSIKNPASFPLSFFSCLLRSEAPFSTLGDTAYSIATSLVTQPSNLQICFFVFSYVSESWSCNISKIQASLSAALLKLVPIVSSPATHPARIQPRSWHRLPDAPLRLVQFTAASNAMLRRAGWRGQFAWPGHPPSFLAVSAHPPLCPAAAASLGHPRAYFLPHP